MSILMSSVTLIIIVWYVWYSPVFEVFKMGCNISVGQDTEFIRPGIVKSQSQPLFLTHPLIQLDYSWTDGDIQSLGVDRWLLLQLKII